MVGLPRKYLPLVESIVGGFTLVFLFNFSDRKVRPWSSPVVNSSRGRTDAAAR